MNTPSLSAVCPGLVGESTAGGGFPAVRGRRLRRTPALRRLVAENRIHPAELVLPLFVREGLAEPREITSLPGVQQHSLDSVRKQAAAAVAAGLGGVMLFGVPSERDAVGSAGTDPAGVLQRALRAVKSEVGSDLVVMSDVCLDEVTSHSHCGVLDEDGVVDNDATLLRYAEMALVQVDAGADVLGLSGMMDGQVAAVRTALDATGQQETAILAYAAKYASAFYGPFRDAVESTLVGDRRSYQQDPANAREALREVDTDIAEGADIVMVKPALAYLDVVRQVRDRVTVPVAAYQVSGEYAMVMAAARAGWIDGEAAMAESLVAIKRAGAGMIVSYWALRAAEVFA